MRVGASGVEVAVLAANVPARRFYEALGASYLGPAELDEDGESLTGAIYEWPSTREPAKSVASSGRQGTA